MYGNKARHNAEMEMDIKQIFAAICKKLWLVILAAVLGAGLSFGGTKLLVDPEFESSAMFYVNNNAFSVGGTSVSITSSDISASKSLVNTYIVILNTRQTLTEVIDHAGVDRTYSEVAGMITAEAVEETEVFRVTVTSTDPNEAERLANAIAEILPARINGIVEGTSAKIVDSAVVPYKASAPSVKLNAVLGFLLGITISASVILLRELFDNSVRSEEDIARITRYPVLAAVPDMTALTKGGYYGYSDRKPAARTGGDRKTALTGGQMSFAASEAYKLLRTKLQFSFAQEDGCRVLGLTSALSGEGKSLSAVNLARVLAQLEKKVLLIDCDMRRPTLASKLSVSPAPGLSGYLTGQCRLEDIRQYCGISGEERLFQVIAAGQNPPNPMELLGSSRMGELLELLRGEYDYIVLDLPPVGEVGDALVTAELTDGMILVVRHDYCERTALMSTVSQLEFMGSRILGILFNCAEETGGIYGKKYYKKYHRGRADDSASAGTARKKAARKRPDTGRRHGD